MTTCNGTVTSCSQVIASKSLVVSKNLGRTSDVVMDEHVVGATQFRRALFLQCLKSKIVSLTKIKVKVFFFLD